MSLEAKYEVRGGLGLLSNTVYFIHVEMIFRHLCVRPKRFQSHHFQMIRYTKLIFWLKLVKFYRSVYVRPFCIHNNFVRVNEELIRQTYKVRYCVFSAKHLDARGVSAIFL